jgi:hypothetical protein
MAIMSKQYLILESDTIDMNAQKILTTQSFAHEGHEAPLRGGSILFSLLIFLSFSSLPLFCSSSLLSFPLRVLRVLRGEKNKTRIPGAKMCQLTNFVKIGDNILPYFTFSCRVFGRKKRKARHTHVSQSWHQSCIDKI